MNNLAVVTARLFKAALTLFAVIVISFVLIRMAPGDPALMLAGDAGVGDSVFVEEIRRDLGLDRGLDVQLASYLKSVLSFDFGISYREKRPVADMVLERVPATLLLTVSALAFAVVTGVGMGALSARKPGSLLDGAITTVSVAFFAMPMFWIGLMFIIGFAVRLDWFPSYGMVDATVGQQGWFAAVIDLVKHMVLPVLTLGLYYMSVLTRVSRTALLQVAGADFIRTARAKGLSPRLIWRDHLLRNALLPIITVVALQAAQLVGGSVLVETVFAWPGIGRFAFEALMTRDYNVLLAVFIMTSFGVIVVNLLADMAYRFIDPRVDQAAHV